MPTYALSNVYVVRILSHETAAGIVAKIDSVSLDTSTLPPDQKWVLADSNAGVARKIAGNTDLNSAGGQSLDDSSAYFSIDYDFAGPADTYAFAGLINAGTSSSPEFMTVPPVEGGVGYMLLDWMYEQGAAGPVQVFLSFGSYVPEGGGGTPPAPFWTGFLGTECTP